MSETELSEALAEAAQIIDILNMSALDNEGAAWPRANEWLEKWRKQTNTEPTPLAAPDC